MSFVDRKYRSRDDVADLAAIRAVVLSVFRFRLTLVAGHYRQLTCGKTRRLWHGNGAELSLAVIPRCQNRFIRLDLCRRMTKNGSHEARDINMIRDKM